LKIVKPFILTPYSPLLIQNTPLEVLVKMLVYLPIFIKPGITRLKGSSQNKIAFKNTKIIRSKLDKKQLGPYLAQRARVCSDMDIMPIASLTKIPCRKAASTN